MNNSSPSHRTPSQPASTPVTCRSCRVVSTEWQYDGDQFFHVTVRSPCPRHPPPSPPRLRSVLETAFSDALAIPPPSSPVQAPSPASPIPNDPDQPPSPTIPATTTSGVIRRRRQYRRRNGTDDAIETYCTVRDRVRSGERVSEVLKDLGIHHSTFNRSIRPIGEASVLLPGVVDSDTAYRKVLASCKERLRTVSQEGRDAAKRANLLF